MTPIHTAELGVSVVPVLHGRGVLYRLRGRGGGVETLGVGVCLDGLEFWWVWLMMRRRTAHGFLVPAVAVADADADAAILTCRLPTIDVSRWKAFPLALLERIPAIRDPPVVIRLLGRRTVLLQRRSEAHLAPFGATPFSMRRRGGGQVLGGIGESFGDPFLLLGDECDVVCG